MINTPIDPAALLRESIKKTQQDLDNRIRRIEKLKEENNALQIKILALEEAVKLIEAAGPVQI